MRTVASIATAACLLGGCSLGGGNATPTAGTQGSASPSQACAPPQGHAPILLQSVPPITGSPPPATVYRISGDSAPRTLVTMDANTSQPAPRFINGGKIAFQTVALNRPNTKMETLDVSRGTREAVFSIDGSIPAYAWTRDGSILVYIAHVGDQSELHLRVGRADNVAAQLGKVPGRGVSPDDEVLVAISCDDRYVAVVDTEVGTSSSKEQRFRVYALHKGGLEPVFAPASGRLSGVHTATMAAWSKVYGRLYYRDDSGVRVWDAADGSDKVAIDGARWYHPSLSPDGMHVAYAVLRAGQSVIHVYNFTNAKVDNVGPSLRANPFYVSADTVAYQGLTACPNPCLEQYVPSGKVYAAVVGQSETEVNLPGLAEVTDVLNR